MDLKELKYLGLTEGEAKVYLSLMDLGLATKGPIATKAKVSESKVYEILDRLKEKGLLSFVSKKKGVRIITHYKAANPVMLKEFLNKKREEINKEEEILKKLLPILQSQQKEKEKEYSAVIYEGFKGIQTNNLEVLEMISENDEWVAMGTRSNKSEEFNIFWVNWLRQRAEKGGKARILFVDQGTWYYKQLARLKNTQVGYLKGIAPASVAVTKNRVMIFSYGDSSGCLAVTNQGVADSFRGFFESLWKLAEKKQ
ncbi:hypothetical protein COU54_03410 [Candidatus Pacearchaeota archaeon CG10_big_fil_rev_8_21_14_0_10_31_24]|nr:MAG: hypothetical protein COU54_03410 [Candidatus Pacearchaeota archaeon CG10_big_fil_rev_8_21_14_0_10_31_24]